MRNPNPSVSAKTALTILLLTHTTTALPFIPNARVSSIRPPVTTLNLDRSPGSLLQINPGLMSNRNVNTTKRAVAKNTTKTTATTTTTTTPSGTSAAAADDDGGGVGGDGGDDKKNREITINRRRTNEEEEESNKNNNNNNDNNDTTTTTTTKPLPIIRIFPDGSFATLTPEETKEFYIVRTAQGEGPDVRDPPLEHPAPTTTTTTTGGGPIDQTPKASREPSEYDQSRTCASSGEWCPLPREEGSTLLAGTGIGSCMYYREDGLWGKTVTYHAC